MKTADIIRIAEGNQPLMDGTTEPVQAIVASADIVIAVWPDADLEEGAGTLVIKGEPLMRDIIQGAPPSECRLSAVWVDSAEMAMAARIVFGDGES